MSWNDITNNSNNGGNKKEVKYATLTSGQTHQLRALDEEPYSRWTHWIGAANGGKGMSIDCNGNKDCPACAKIRELRAAKKQDRNLSSKKSHAMNFIQRKLGADGKLIPGEVGEVVVVDKGNGFYEPLAGFIAEIGDLRGYDVKIRVTGEGMDTSYVPIPLPSKALTPDELALVKYDFKEIYKKPTNEQTLALMNGASAKDVFGSADTDTTDASTDEVQPDVDFNAQS